MISGIGDRLLGNSSCIFSVAPFKELNTAFTSSRPINAEHTQVANVHTKLLYCTTPARSIVLHYEAPNTNTWKTDLKVSHAAIKTLIPF